MQGFVMARVGKFLTVFFVLIIAISSVFMVRTADAQSIPKPSVPEFTLKYVDRSYDIPPTYGVDGDGNPVVVLPGYREYNRTVDVIIKNQPFKPVKLDGNLASLHYNVMSKGHDEDWVENDLNQVWRRHVNASESAETVITIPLDFIGVAGERDFKVQAEIGYWYYDSFRYAVIFNTINEGNWSSVQTITIPAISPAPTVPELSWLAIIPLMASILSVVVIIRHRKTSSLKQ
jgi:hypothetical protein